MKNIKNIKIFAIFATCTTMATTVAVSGNKVATGLFAAERDEVWYHYGAVESTCARYGIKEYWTNCNGTTVIEQPAVASFVERTLAEEQINEIVSNESDERLVAKKEHACDSYAAASGVIGYKYGTCSVCGGTASRIVDNNDIANAGRDWGLCSAFGGNGTAANKSSFGEFPEYADLVGCKSAWNNDTAGNVKALQLPKVNFQLFDKVAFVFHTNSGANANTAFGFGTTESGDDLFGYSVRGVRDEYVLACEYADGKVNCSLTSSFVSKTFIVDNDEVETGKASLSLYTKMGAWRTLALDSVVVNEDLTVNNVVVSDFSTYRYGAEAASGVNLAVGQDSNTTCLTWSSASGNALETTIGLPKITYTNYDKVVFNLYANGGSSWSETIGLNASQANKISQNDGHTLTVYKTSEGSYKAKLDLIYGNGKPSFEMAITDADVLSGSESLYGVYYKASGAWRNICVTSFVVNPVE